MPPPGYERTRVGSADVVARIVSMNVVRDLITKSGTLYAAVAALPGAQPVAGRGTAYAIRTRDGAWLVRHYRRGGALAWLLNDRYLRVARGRAVRELNVSAAARAVGIPTPEVVAAVTYTSATFARFDIAVTWIDDAVDLAGLLFARTGRDIDVEIAKAAALIQTLCERGLQHADLNLKNILLAPGGAYVVDLDRCRLISTRLERNAAAMRQRFVRSLEKWEVRTGLKVATPHLRTLTRAFRVR
jgi:3-deoxy-D-manno-octulosonic acid kinase